MTNEKFKVSRRKKWRLLLASILAILPIAFMIASSAAHVPTDVEDVYTLDVPKLLIVGIPVLLGFSAAFFVLAHLYTKSERFYFEDNKLHYYFTFVIKKRVSLPLEKINVVKLKRSLLDLILGISRVEIGSGNMATSFKAEIKLCLNKDKAAYVADFIQRYSKAVKENKQVNEEFEYLSDASSLENADKTNNADTDSVTVKMTKADKLRFVMTNLSVWIMLLGCVAGLIIPLIVKQISPTSFAKNSFNDVFKLTALLSILFFIATIIGSLCYAFLVFYNYTITRKGDEIIIHYGLINIKTFAVSFDKIHGYMIRQGILRQIFKQGSLRLSVVGIDDSAGGDDNAKTTYLYPCATLGRLKEIIKILLPEFAIERELTRPTKKSFAHTVIVPNAFTILFLLPFLVYLAFAVTIWALVIPILVIIILGGIKGLLVYKHAGFSIDSDFVYAVSGGFIKKHTLIKTGSVQEISTFAGFVRRKQGLCSYLVVYRGSSILSTKLFIRNLPLISLDSLE